ncbi:hypothetical protein RhiTH_011256 [Rhizoctonia solani]
MPELKDIPLADDPLPTHGTSEGEHMTAIKNETSIDEMLAVVAAKKAALGGKANAKPYTGIVLKSKAHKTGESLVPASKVLNDQPELIISKRKGEVKDAGFKRRKTQQ